MITKLKRIFWRRMVTASMNKVRIYALRKLGCAVGESVYIGPGLTIAAGYMDMVDRLEIGNRVSFAPNVSLILGSHPNNSRLNKLFNKSWGKGHVIRIGDDSWLGANSVVLPDIKIGKCCVIGAGSVVTKDVPDYAVVGGVPAKILRMIDPNTID